MDPHNRNSQYPYQNPDLPLEDRVSDLVSRFTPEEKVELMMQYQAAVPRLGVAPYKHGTEAAHGVAWLGEATSYPQPIGLACTWDAELLKRVGSAIGDEARGFYKRNPAVNGLTLWAPTVDMERDPRWGRTEEAYGEDPVLVGKLSSALIQGIQGDDPRYLKAVASLKHFIGNNNEVGRGDASVSIDPRNMREYYLKPFEIAFKEGGAQSMMTSYNAVNGVPANLNPDVDRIVKQEWGMDGFVVSDAFDVTGTVREHHYVETYKEAVARSIREGGIDSITDDAELSKQALRDALSEGLIAENDLDVALRNTFRVRFRLGEFDPPERNPYAAIDESAILRPEHAELSREAAGKAVVLLKNEGELLPLAANKLGKVAVIGPLGDTVYRDWYSGTLPYAVTPLQGIREKLEEAGAGGRASFVSGSNRVKLQSERTGRFVRAGADERAALAADAEDAADADIFETTDWGWGSHTFIAERNGRYLTTDDKTVQASATQIWEWFTKETFNVRPAGDGGPCAFATWNGTPVTVGPSGELLVGDGEAEETANEINVTGATDSADAAGLQASESDRFRLDIVTDGAQAAAEAARGADAAIVFVGNHPLINGKETIDRPDIALAASQEALIREVFAANPNTIVVVVGSYPFALNWADANVPAILYTSHAGQELGRAVADVLFGDVNPAGRLNMTWYAGVDQLPDFMDYDVIRGGRTYQYFEGKPLYPFGYGLSYTDFRYDDLRISAADATAAEAKAQAVVECRVTNAGARAGEEVVQLYVQAGKSRVKRPRLQLQAFERIALAAGETKAVRFVLPLSALAVWDVTRDRFCVESGDYAILIGASSADLRLTGTLAVEGETIPPRDLRRPTRAVNYDDYAGVIVGECREGGSAAVAAGGAGWIAFEDAEFGDGVVAFEVRAACVEAAAVEVRLQRQDGPLAGRCVLPPGGAQEWRSFSCGVTGIAGRQRIYLVVSGGAAISRFRFF
ncbi:glycoside hydrolase family 3 C-terminal domain-containing protein [Cohnella ginsengisoli]|uniref:Glycoside hydrolase family 3 C-terminal domain-containing protein n=1 Tax=Cohnella ginsengisoli TaxID=425004 RepID=A0A9X4QPW9_9BACL|nr:glycoside hydrolase family 3 protein [Cohnella ginsengisoli]MDG0794824.1 glycoside hydrolase family 3 C-terminal domain-containing protein [Cohnella ginsengisoli]